MAEQEFDVRPKTKGLGMRLVRALLQQLEVAVAVNSQPRGTEFVVLVPLEPKP